MAGASVETTLELWASSLRDVKARIRPLFSQERVAVSAGEFLEGLLGNEPRKTGWMRAEAAGDSGPWAGDPGPRPVGRRCVARDRARCASASISSVCDLARITGRHGGRGLPRGSF